MSREGPCRALTSNFLPVAPYPPGESGDASARVIITVVIEVTLKGMGHPGTRVNNYAEVSSSGDPQGTRLIVSESTGPAPRTGPPSVTCLPRR